MRLVKIISSHRLNISHFEAFFLYCCMAIVMAWVVANGGQHSSVAEVVVGSCFILYAIIQGSRAVVCWIVAIMNGDA